MGGGRGEPTHACLHSLRSCKGRKLGTEEQWMEDVENPPMHACLACVAARVGSCHLGRGGRTAFSIIPTCYFTTFLPKRMTEREGDTGGGEDRKREEGRREREGEEEGERE